MTRRAYTLIELLTTIAVLVILLGLMVELAHQVRSRSANQLTRDLLEKLDRLTVRYLGRTGGSYPDVPPLLASAGSADEPALHKAALANNQALVLAFRRQGDLLGQELANLPITVFDERTIRDAWGTPIAFMPPRAANIGMLPQDRFFFFSAGPDRRFLTREDNLYSYEVPAGQ